MSFLITLLPCLPLISGVISRLNNSFATKIISYITVMLIASTSFAAILVFWNISKHNSVEHIILFEWIELLNLKAHCAIYIDKLTALMLVIVSLISTIVHIYSIGYLHEDKELPKFMSYLSFFTFFMLMLVSSDNFLQLFFGWEGVGVSSYLLIGFWHKKYAATIAAYKAFIVNRFADCAFLLAIIAIIYNCNSVEFKTVFSHAEQLSKTIVSIFDIKIIVLDLICCLLFIGCMGKSAQIGLHIWLPDAMEGPTPASALIHAATMVTAGIFLLARCSFMFEYSIAILNLIAITGGFTCILTSIIAVCQNDIKKIIAYSTCSQLGYMVIACGSSSYNGAMFHLLTHAFFKAMLFLAAGNVIHMTHQQDLNKMPQQLWRVMPYTYGLFWLGTLAIVGIFPFSGFYSKDMILESVYLTDNKFVYYLGIIAVFFTAMYSIKLIIGIFHQPSFSSTKHSIKEVSIIMNLPLLILAIGSAISGWYCYNILTIGKVEYFANSLFNNGNLENLHINCWMIKILPILVGVFGLIIGGLIYYYKSNVNISIIRSISSPARNKFYFDEIYNTLLVKTFNIVSYYLSIFDIKCINKFLDDSVIFLVQSGFSGIKKMQSGYVSYYILIALVSMTAFFTLIVINYFITSN
ncbi:NADH-quinone oxidoreductase subunit L [Orientia tsutsugamushi]|uniref:NADH-quinone oxidoreductase subunit L n=1 Tax=Orientia tsutsugamushi TaxID=784 RepID=UPI000D5A4A43|nr:2-hydroxyacid dehydrogenase [Orientia tsutsugamushi]